MELLENGEAIVDESSAEAWVTKRRYQALLLVGILLPLLLYFASGYLFPKNQSLLFRLVESRILIWSILGIMYLFSRYGEVQKFVLWPEQEKPFKFYLLSALGLYFLFIVAGFISYIPVKLGMPDNREVFLQMDAVLKNYPFLLLATCITAGITEELLFRGYMLPRLSLLTNNAYLPVLISAGLFSLIHLGYHNIRELLFTFLFGTIAGFHYKRYQNIKILVLVHILVDLIATGYFKLH